MRVREFYTDLSEAALAAIRRRMLRETKPLRLRLTEGQEREP